MNLFSKRFPTLLGLAVLAAAMAAGVFLVRRQQLFEPRAAGSAVPTGVTISNIGDRSFTVSWTTEGASMGSVFVQGSGLDRPDQRVLDDRDQSDGESRAWVTHYVTVGNLTPSTTYYFLVGSGADLFDQQGSPYSVETGPALPNPLRSDTAQGVIKTDMDVPAEGAIVYAELPGGQLTSALSTKAGNWFIPLSTVRRADLVDWLGYDDSMTVYSLRVDAGVDGVAAAVVTTGLDRPVPPITLGNTYDFRLGQQPVTGGQQPAVRTVPPASLSSLPEFSSLFTFDSLGSEPPAAVEVTLENPVGEGEVMATGQPEFFGGGSVGTQIEIVVESPGAIQGSVVVDETGRWSFTVPEKLSLGSHTVTIRWVDAEGGWQTIARSFVVSVAEGKPAFTATPSAQPQASQAGEQATPTAGLTPSLTPTLVPTITLTPTVSLLTPTPTPGIPESGNLTPSVALFMMGLLSAAGGVALLWWSRLARRGGMNGR